MINSRKKGFTLVELVIVIAVVAILAAVLIPTFSSLVRKANISSDTVVAKNLNTALALYDAENDIEDFDDVLEGVKEAGYLIANLNAKASGCFFVWEKDSNQILLVDSKEGYKVLFSAKDGYGNPDESWHFAISDRSIVKEVEDHFGEGKVTIMNTISNSSDLKEAIQEGGELYIDESVVLSEDNLIEVKNSDVVLNLGSSLLNTNGILSNVYPIYIDSGTLTIKGGIIGAAGSYVDADGRVVNTPIATDGGKTYIEGTVFNLNKDGYALFAGETHVKGATFNAENIGIYNNGNGQVYVEDSTIISKGRCIWSCNYTYINGVSGEADHVGNTTIFIASGVYKGGNANYAPIVACGGNIEINGGTFESIHDTVFQITSSGGTIVITGGTFNGRAFADLTTEAAWEALCNGTGYNVVIETGKVTITK